MESARGSRGKSISGLLLYCKTPLLFYSPLVYALNICEWHGSPRPFLGLDLLRSAALSFSRAVIRDFDICLLVLKRTISSNLAHCCVLTNQTDWDVLGFDLRNQVPSVPATLHSYFVHVRDQGSTGSIFVNTRTNNRAIDCCVWHIERCRKYFSNAWNLIHFSISPSEDTFSLEQTAAIVTNFIVTGYNVFFGIRTNVIRCVVRRRQVFTNTGSPWSPMWRTWPLTENV